VTTPKPVLGNIVATAMYRLAPFRSRPLAEVTTMELAIRDLGPDLDGYTIVALSDFHHHPAVQAMLADSLTELYAARSMLYETARAIDGGLDRKVAHARCSMVKLYASEMAGRVADRAVQIFGGRGYMRENVAERFTRELRVERIWEGASEIQRIIIADQLAKRGRAALV